MRYHNNIPRPQVVNERQTSRSVHNTSARNNFAFVADDDVAARNDHSSDNDDVLRFDDPATEQKLNNYQTSNINPSSEYTRTTNSSQQLNMQKNQLHDEYVTKEVNVDEDIIDENENLSVKSLNNSFNLSQNEQSFNSFEAETPSSTSDKRRSFISPQMMSNFQNKTDKKSRKEKDSKSKAKPVSIFGSFHKTKISPSLKTKSSKSKFSPSKTKGQDNLGVVTDESMFTPSVVLTPPTPSPEPSSSPQYHGRQSPKTIISSNSRQKEQINPNNRDKQDKTVTPAEKNKNKPTKKKKSSRKQHEFPIEILLNDISDDDDPAVVLAEAVISPPSPVTETRTETSNTIERKFKRKVESGEPQLSSSAPTKKTNFFKIFKSSDSRNSKRKSGDKDKNMMGEKAVKDVYITGNYHGQESGISSGTEDDHSPPVVHFKNLAQNPDLQGND